MKLTRQQELALIEIGFKTLLRGLVPNDNEKPVKKPRKKKSRKWTPAQREKFKATMQKKYGKRFTSK